MIRCLIPDLPQATELLPWLQRIDASRWYTNGGPLVREFEQRLCAFLEGGGSDASCVTLSSGMSSLELGLLALGVGAGKRVLLPALTGPNGEPPLFTDFTYDNIGMPKNPMNPFYYAPPSVNPDRGQWIDPGLGGFLKAAGYPPEVYEPEWGKQKVPTLRNVDKRPYPEFVKAFGHNGFFKSLEQIVHFYNTRDVEMWPPPEVAENVNTDELGNLGLTADEEAALVAFMKTLTDGYTP